MKKKLTFPSESTEIKIYAYDIGSGIDLTKTHLRVDRKRVKWDYDPDKRYFEILPHNRIWKKGKHSVMIQIADRAENWSPKKSFNYFIK